MFTLVPIEGVVWVSVYEDTVSEGRIGPGSEGWGGNCGGSSGDCVGPLMSGSTDKDSSEEGFPPSNSPLTVALRGSAVPGVAIVLQFPGLVELESN